MKRTLSTALLTLAALSSYASLQSGADQIINQVSPSLNIGVEVVDLTTGATLFRRNPTKAFVPASNMKLFSDAAALMVLGPDYRFRNELSTNSAQLQQGVLKGSLYLHLTGDPSFSHDRLANLFAGLKTWKVNRIQGNVYIDSSHSAVSPYPPGWMAEDRVYSYGAPLAPVMIDTNRLTVTVNPSGKVDELAIVETNDASHSISINNQVRTKPKGSRCGVSFNLDQNNHLTVNGCVIVGQWAVQQQMAIRNPLAFAQGLIKQQLAEANISLEGNVLLGKTPAGSLLIASETSKPISQLMADTLKPSDNLYADSLFLHAAEKLHGSPVNWPEAQILVKNFIQQQTGIELKNAVLTDGSGLSRHDLITPAQTAALLRFLHDKFPLSYEYIAALPVSGRDGTLQRRFKGPMQQDLVRAKTGTMRGIVSLSGYLYTANAHTLAFAIFINHVPGTKSSISGKYRYVVDALCSYFLQQKPGNNTWAKVFAPHGRLKFQQNPTQAEVQKSRQARWRRLETVVKNALRGQAVTVIYRGNELVLKDNQPDTNSVLNALKVLRNKYSFAVALTSKSIPSGLGIRPLVLWMQDSGAAIGAQRVWTIRESVA
ncbi:D-alanyl-D-alanine carboxypeptidase/D-alanyl-D-alanine endopeptidase [Legionella jordanis]|uniref:D-alanyl-D-alanine carboxypeptidase n=1 Tax=Legionella jordanis TaxID=456 RepID=A0A0W0VDM6_9GAMM|nr:D-alanyl-D-alanine carboxypeptidase/D-alanyl-D-alanine-endopeptidase [Legionella jordanis]KTD18228.1 D-alanyl-D-alanine carboxypeptidase [Legionella jordanis]RMX01186.1 D-alanyl-D-alanine carboxypeptidase/D-alanyl-D-alanine-endopeptidase [Legionella jordanis]RMX21416.1 D-alanyl-D-alanine carboxypeptidase/D-alanyl-D-alanine-endopeptidase [Legionella jordanis]VEH13679.1 D-alanyl-D-alanine carboxypeptidase [Legionella jordanis]HAT8714610.1 D-alanyl-D-alanine carboxypeptidase/D-alanyl-D-alanine